MKIRKLFGLEWRLEKTRHFDYYIRPTNRVVKLTTLNKSDRHVEKICRLWKIKPNKRIKFFVVADRDEITTVFGKKTSGFTDLKKYSIRSVYIYHPHEITHIILGDKTGHRPIMALSEGAAVLYGWKSGWDNKPIEEWQKIFKRKNKIVRLKKLLDKNSFTYKSEPTYYPQYAAFVKFFIKKFGMSKFKALYKLSSNIDGIEATVNKIEKISRLKFSELEKKYFQH